MRLPVSGPIPHAAVRRTSDRFYPSRDRYTEDSLRASVRAARRLQLENPDASKLMFTAAHVLVAL